MDRTERLLRVGYLPSQLPPSFTTRDLALRYSALLLAWTKISEDAANAAAKKAGLKPPKRGVPKAPSGKLEAFSVARAGHQRRVTSIPNPIGQTYLSQAVVDNWKAIVKHYRGSKLSASHPRFRRSGSRAASLPPMQGLHEKCLLQGAGYRYVLRTDVSRFFPTVYTHSIPWSLHGKATAKKNRRSLTPKFFGNLLDLATRQCQDEQTIGLAIGPDTSHIIAECIATAIDLDLAKRLRGRPAGFRYVDDFYFFFETHAQAEAALAHLIRSLKEFELQINFAKTSICRPEELKEDVWTYELRSCNVATNGRRQRSDLNFYFELARNLAGRHTDESVMVYALRRLRSVIVRVENWDAFEAQLCRIAAAHPVTLQNVARILSTYSGLGYPIDKIRLSRLVNALFAEHAALEHHSEVAWSLWMCKEHQLSISPANVDAVAEMNSSVTSLLLLDLANLGLLPKAPSGSRWKDIQTSDALWDDLWMLSYEAGIRGWGGMTDAHVAADSHFNEMRQLGVHFYNPNERLAPIFTPKADALANVDYVLAKLLQSEDLDSVFEHEDDDDPYGSPSESDDKDDNLVKNMPEDF